MQTMRSVSLVLTLLLSTPALAQVPEDTSSEGGDAQSPQQTISVFLDAANAGDYAKAGTYLTLPSALADRGSELAKRFAHVLTQRLDDVIDSVSPHTEGDRNDGLPPDYEQVGTIKDAQGRQAAVRLERHAGRTPQWKFSERTVARIDAWYEALPNRWLIEHLPPIFQRRTVADLEVWQLIALPAGLAVIWLLALIASGVTRAIATRLVKRTNQEWDDLLVGRLSGPLTLGWLVAFVFVAQPFLALPAAPSAWLMRIIRVAVLVTLFWAISRAVEVARVAVGASPWIATRPATRALLPVVARVTKVAVFGFAVVVLLSELGYPVASIIAGLGIGGLAFALAAQKTIENLFGAFSIGADQPFREGDFVKIEDFVGTVEAIGLRSTRIRTLDRTIITLPNGKLADMRLESFTARERMRLATTISLVYETTVPQMKQVLADLEATLRAHPKIWPDAVVVRFSALGPTSLDIEVMAWFQTPDWGEFQLIRQDILMQFMEVVQRAGTAFAFPTQTVHLVKEDRFSEQP